MPDVDRTRLWAWLSGSGVIAVAMAVMNVTTYAFTIFAARVLGPVEYGALAAVMGLLLVLNVLSLGLQATGARRVAAAPDEADRIEREVMRSTYICSLSLGGVALLAVPLVDRVLQLDSWATAAMIAVTIVPLTLMGGQAGILQGERRWKPLALVFLGVGVGRLAFGGFALVVEPDTLGAMLGVAAGAVVPAAVGWWALHHPPQDRGLVASEIPVTSSLHPHGSVLRETMHNSHALLAFFALSSIDVVVARATLDEHQAGLYAGGLILTKAVLFLPQFVVIIVFPSMSSARSARRMNVLALGLVFAIGLAVVVGVAVLSGLAVTFVGGPDYAELQSSLWAFAVLGTLLAMIQVMVYNVLARQRRRAVFAIWAALLVVIAAVAFVDTVTELLSVVLLADTGLLVALATSAALRSRQRTPDADGVDEVDHRTL